MNDSKTPASPPRIAVCLAAYRGMQYIDAQFATILGQQNVAVQIFVNVDCSDDGTELHVARLALAEPRITVLPFGNRFGGAGPNFYHLLRNIDVDAFDYVSLADQDDLWEPEKLWKAHTVMAASGAAGYSSNVTAFWPDGKTRLVDKAQPQRCSDFLFEAAGPGCTYVLQRGLARAIQEMIIKEGSSLSEMGYHDWLFYAYARANGYRWIIDDWSSIRYRQHASNQLGVNAGWRSFWRRAKKMLEGHGFEQALLIARLVNAQSSEIVKRGLRGGRLGYLWLALRGTQCRRKRLDQLSFVVLCVVFAIANPGKRRTA